MTNIEKPHRRIRRRRYRRYKESKYVKVHNSFFLAFRKREDVKKAIVFLSSEWKFVYKRFRPMISLALEIAYEQESVVVKTKHSELDSRKYIRRFTSNLFKCLTTCGKYLQNDLMLTDVPNTLFHGTTTKFLPNIMKQGLLPCKTGQCWDEIKDTKLKRVCLTDSLFAAEEFALYATNKFGGEPIVLKVNVKGNKHMLKLRSEIFPPRGSSFRVFHVCKDFSSTEPIPKDRIKDWYVLPNPPASVILEYISYSLCTKKK